MPDIWFPYLGIKIEHLSKIAFSIGNYTIAWYGIILASGVVFGLLMARYLAKKSDQDPELYTDFLIYALIFSLIGARTYYVAFEWEHYKNDLLSILDFRGGGIAIYGAVIASILTAVIYCKIKHYSLLELMDTAMPGLILGQAIGRWGNFFNQEAFGGYTDSFFAMRLNVKTAAYTTTELIKHAVKVGDVNYIQVHPTFLYESFGCLVILAIMIFVFRRRKFKGQVASIYMIGYGILRAFIENLRTDQLKVWNTNYPVSVFVSIVFALTGIIMMIVLGVRAKNTSKKEKNKDKKNEFAPDLDDDEDETASEEDADEKETSEKDEASSSDSEDENDAEDAEKAADETASAKETKEDEKPSEDDLWN